MESALSPAPAIKCNTAIDVMNESVVHNSPELMLQFSDLACHLLMRNKSTSIPNPYGNGANTYLSERNRPFWASLTLYFDSQSQRVGF